MNIREIAKNSSNYYEINREERNYAAILFAALCKEQNISQFLALLGFDYEKSDDFGIYFEYSYLRDLWWRICDEDVKKTIISSNLELAGINDILSLSNIEINKKFGVAGPLSTEYVQFPGRWSISKYNSNFSDNEEFLKVCKFKWSFNIKPDIVIHLNKNRAICIEAKYQSGEGFYPNSEKDKSIFTSRGLKYVGQMELQKYMMEELLGIDTDFVFLVAKKSSSNSHKVVTWSQAFEALDLSAMPLFAQAMAKNISAA